MAIFYLRQNDASVSLTATLQEASGAAIDLTDCTVTFAVGYEGDPASKLLDAAAVVTDAENGKVRFTFTALQTDLDPGTYDAAFTLTWADGTTRTVPTRSGQLKVQVVGEVA